MCITMSTAKKLLMCEWIRHHLDMKSFQEMKYTDKTKTRFQINWMHKSNRNWNEKEASVFKSWAEYKGKLGNFSYTRAKTNFRMALRYQPKIREVTQRKRNLNADKSGRRKNSEDAEPVKIYEFVLQDADESKKPKKPRLRTSSTDSSSQECSASPLTILPSTSSQESFENVLPWKPSDVNPRTDILPLTTQGTSENYELPFCGPSELSNTINHAFPEEADALDLLTRCNMSGFPSTTTPHILVDQLELNLADDGDFVQLPSYQELVKKDPQSGISKSYGDATTRYLPIYESITDMEITTTDDIYKSKLSYEHFPDDISSMGENLSLYSNSSSRQGFESDCQVSSTNNIDDTIGFGFSDIEAFERMETFIDQILVRCFS